MKKAMRICAYWVGSFLYYVVIILAVGSVLGACLFTFFGTLFGDYTLKDLFKKGLWIGFRYAGVWAGGLAIVLCFFKGGRRRVH